jgi:hypothetical protein
MSSSRCGGGGTAWTAGWRLLPQSPGSRPGLVWVREGLPVSSRRPCKRAQKRMPERSLRGVSGIKAPGASRGTVTWPTCSLFSSHALTPAKFCQDRTGRHAGIVAGSWWDHRHGLFALVWPLLWTVLKRRFHNLPLRGGRPPPRLPRRLPRSMRKYVRLCDQPDDNLPLGTAG